MKSIQEDIKKQEFKPVYLLFGEEAYLRQQYKQMLLKALVPENDTMNFSRYEGRKVEPRQIIDLAETMPFFASKRVILLENTGFFKNKCEELAEYLKQVPDYLCIIFVETEVDKRGKMYKAAKAAGRVVEFSVQNSQMLTKWVLQILNREGKKITQRNMELFLTKTGTDMGNIRMELEKLLSYTMGRSVVEREDIEAVCTTQTTNKIFEMVRAVTEKDQKKALDLYNDLLTLREPPMRILFLLARQFNQLMVTKEMMEKGYGQPEIASRLGVPPFVARSYLQIARRYRFSQLLQAVKDFTEAEELVKTGRLGEALSVELLIVKYSA